MLPRQVFQLLSPGGERGRLSILIFHRVLQAPDPLFPDELDIHRFDQTLSWLKTWFNVIPLAEAVSRLHGGDLPPRAAAITFDDGYADNLVNATPVLQKHGMHSTFFIATGFLNGGRMWNDTIIESVRGTVAPEMDLSSLGVGVLPLRTLEEKRSALQKIIPAVKHLRGGQRADAVDRFADSCRADLPNDLMLTNAQLGQLRQAGMAIGAHTVSHPILARLNAAEARQEMADSRDMLESLLGERVGMFAYPNGKLGPDYTSAHVEMARSLGFDAAVATNWGACTKGSDPFQMPRFTPWDTRRWRFGLRLLMNMRHPDVALASAPTQGDFEDVRRLSDKNAMPAAAQSGGEARDTGFCSSKRLPSISVVIPAYNAERWIGATLRSVLAQDWPELEVVVVDDGSTDTTVELVRSQFPGVLLVRQENRGVAAARNNGIANAKGDWIAFADADDIWLPGKLAAQWRALSADAGARMSYTAWHVWPCIEPEPAEDLLEQLKSSADDVARWAGPSGWIYADLLDDCRVWTSTVLAHRSLFDEIGVFDESLPIGEDYDLWLRASRVTPIVQVPTPLALYRMHPGSITKRAPEINYQALVVSRAVARWGYRGARGGRCAAKPDVDRALARTWRDFAGAHLAAGNLERARYGGLMCLRSDWRQWQAWKLVTKTVVCSLARNGKRR